jgi:hypothetical protein
VANQQTVAGIYITSHRPIYFYQRVDQIPTTLDPHAQLFQTYFQEILNRYTGTYSGRSPSARLKEALISLATFGYGNEAVEANPDAVQIYEGFETVLRKVLPKTLRFRKLRIRTPEIVFETGSGQFPFDSMSGGMAAIIDLAWQIYMRSLTASRFVVVIDEPENHLHPQLQQNLLPSFLRAFPRAQFIVATHNPFIVSAQRSSSVYVLQYNSARRVVSEMLDLKTKAATANDVLREVLGLPYTLPSWAAADLQRVVRRHAERGLTPDAVGALRAELESKGLEEFYPSALADVARRTKD